MGVLKISTNIERDHDDELDYIVTKNSNDVYNRIIHNSSLGQNSFTIIGSYGTGKSSFLWAFEKHLSGVNKFESPIKGQFKGIKGFDFVRVVGETGSFKSRFCEVFGLSKYKDEPNKVILKEFGALYKEIAKRNRGLVLLVDEFGKYLEYIAKNAVEEMYFIQELAEFCNSDKRKILFINTLHQNFAAYSKGLSKSERSEWDKVKGRLLDVAFDEPVEQLLFFAANKLKEIEVPCQFESAYDHFIDQLVSSNLLGKNIAQKKQMFTDLYPLDALAADILTKSLQKYGQNERSLFTFLESPELLEKKITEAAFSVADCFDYLTKNLSQEIEDGEKNPFKPQWKAAVMALEKAEFLFENQFNEASKLIKTICLVNIFSNSKGLLNDSFLIEYGRIVLKIKDAQFIIDKLCSNGIIKFSNHRSKYNFIEGTDVDIEQELINATKYIEHNISVANRVAIYFDFGILPAKKYQFERGTPRLFGFNYYDEFSFENPTGEFDGFINLIFTKNRIEKQVIKDSLDAGSAQIFVLFKEVETIKYTLLDIDKLDYVIGKFSDDKVALRILNEEKQYRVSLLEKNVSDALYDKYANVTWIWNGEKVSIRSDRDLNKQLSIAAEKTYPDTPRYLNEMVNKEYLSSPILTARRALLSQMIVNGESYDIGFSEEKFPPEKTIYLSLLKKTGIHRQENKLWGYHQPTEESFLPLWQKSMEILNNSQESKLPISDFYDELSQGTLKLKHGFLDFWIPMFLIIKKEDYSLYHQDGEYIPHLTHDVLDVMYKSPKKFRIKGLKSNGVQSNYLSFYKELTDFNESNVKGLESSYITIYSNFLKFYRGLPVYTKKTKQLPKETLNVREAIVNASDPETALFDKIPTALGYFNINNPKQLEEFLNDLKGSIRNLRTAYEDLIDNIQNEILEHFDMKGESFESFKSFIVKNYGGINKNLIVNNQIKIFHTRVVSLLDIKSSYWEGVCDTVLGKRLETVTDEEIGLLITRLKNNLDTLTDLVDIHSLEMNNDESVYQVNILSNSADTKVKSNIVISKEKEKRASKLQDQINKVLDKDSSVNKYALLKLLEKELNK